MLSPSNCSKATKLIHLKMQTDAVKWQFSSTSEAQPYPGVTGQRRSGRSPCPHGPASTGSLTAPVLAGSWGAGGSQSRKAALAQQRVLDAGRAKRGSTRPRGVLVPPAAQDLRPRAGAPVCAYAHTGLGLSTRLCTPHIHAPQVGPRLPSSHKCTPAAGAGLAAEPHTSSPWTATSGRTGPFLPSLGLWV